MAEDKASNPLLAWSSFESNKIHIGSLEKEELYSNFDGALISADTKDATAHLASIPGSNQLISAIHGGQAANFQIIDVSTPGVKKMVFEFQEVKGNVGKGDIAFNSKKGCAALIPVQGETAYHFFDCDSMSVVRMSKWPAEHTASITSLSFDAEAKNIVSIDQDGTFVVSEVNSDAVKFALPLKKVEHPSETNRVRWSPIQGDNNVYVKYDFFKFNILDVEKKTLVLTEDLHIDKYWLAYWIDVSPCGNLIAEAGEDVNINIFDKRTNSVVKTINDVLPECAQCVKWSADGKLLAVASEDNTAKVVNFESGKVIYSKATCDEKYAHSVAFI